MAEKVNAEGIVTRRAAMASMLGLVAGGAALGSTWRLPTYAAPAPVAVAPIAPPPLKDWPELDARAQAMIDARMTPGLSLSVMRKGVRLYSKGFGLADVSADVAVSRDSGFRIASITKQFTAAAVLSLVDAGKLGLDDPLAATLPDFPDADKITLRQLLTHTSGLGDYINGQDRAILDRARAQDYALSEVLSLITARRPLYRAAPGTRWIYSNSGYTVLSAVIEKASGQTYADYCRSALFEPAGLAHTTIDPSCTQFSGCNGYVPAKGGFEAVAPLSPSFISGAGAIRSTPDDLCAWHSALIAGKVIKPRSFEAMLTPAMLADGRPAGRLNPREPMTYGLGQNLGAFSDFHVFAHSGGIRGFTGHLRSLREPEITVAYQFNTDGGGTRRFREAVRDLRTEALKLAMNDAGLPWPEEALAEPDSHA